MCLTFCFVREILFDSDDDWVCGVCWHNCSEGKPCETCVYRAGALCALTNASRPDRGWCCHHTNAERWVTPPQRVFSEQAFKGFHSPTRVVLKIYGAQYEVIGRGLVRIAMSSLSVPLVYGVPTAHWLDELWPPHQELDLTIEFDGDFVLEL